MSQRSKRPVILISVGDYATNCSRSHARARLRRTRSRSRCLRRYRQSGRHPLANARDRLCGEFPLWRHLQPALVRKRTHKRAVFRFRGIPQEPGAGGLSNTCGRAQVETARFYLGVVAPLTFRDEYRARLLLKYLNLGRRLRSKRYAAEREGEPHWEVGKESHENPNRSWFQDASNRPHEPAGNRLLT